MFSFSLSVSIGYTDLATIVLVSSIAYVVKRMTQVEIARYQRHN